MLEAITIMSIVFACLYFPLRGKTYEELSEGQAKRVQKELRKLHENKKRTENTGFDYSGVFANSCKARENISSYGNCNGAYLHNRRNIYLQQNIQ